jgi:hypothetical protein
MINEHDINDMLPRTMAERLVGKSFGEEVPEAAFPSLIKFMHSVAEEAAAVCTAASNKALAEDIRVHFGMQVRTPCFLLTSQKKKQKELDLECGK